MDGVVDIMLDATQHYQVPLTAKRLFSWHAALFTTGRSSVFEITVADWRKDKMGPMQVVSETFGKEKVHYQAPSSKRLKSEMNPFLS